MIEMRFYIGWYQEGDGLAEEKVDGVLRFGSDNNDSCIHICQYWR